MGHMFYDFLYVFVAKMEANWNPNGNNIDEHVEDPKYQKYNSLCGLGVQLLELNSNGGTKIKAITILPLLLVFFAFEKTSCAMLIPRTRRNATTINTTGAHIL